MPNIIGERTFIAFDYSTKQQHFCLVNNMLNNYRTPDDIQCSKVHRPCTMSFFFYKAIQEETTALFVLIWWRAAAQGKECIMMLDENWKKFTQKATGNSVCPAHSYGTIPSSAYNQFRDEVLSSDNQCMFQSYSALRECNQHFVQSTWNIKFSFRAATEFICKTSRRHLFDCIYIWEACC